MLKTPVAALLVLLFCGRSVAAEEVLGFTLNEPIEASLLGASRDGAPPRLSLHTSNLLPESAARTQQWTASQHWWYTQPLAIPARLADRDRTLQLAIDAERRPFWLLLAIAAPDCRADRDWLQQALTARYEPAISAASDALVDSERPLLFQSEDGRVLISARCEQSALTLEYLMPAGFNRAYERNDRLPASDSPANEYPQVLADTSKALLRGNRDSLESWLGLSLSEDGVSGQAPGPEQTFNLADTAFRHLAQHPLLAGASHTLETDALGGVVRMTTVLPDADRALHGRWSSLLRTRFGQPAKNLEKHQIYRIGHQRLILRQEPNALRISYQHLDRKKKERDRLAAEKAARYRESIKGL